MISWRRATNLLKVHIPQLEEEDDLADIFFTCYCDLGMSIQEIALLCQVSSSTLRSKLLRVGIQLKKRGGGRRKATAFVKRDLEEMSLKELSTKYKVSVTTVEKARRRERRK
jgi:DNA-directed RNA polymerase specialized sigma24 family protein